jgi:demethylmenaquinone methyltransferase/2-methoxy-6-polyprenyl-1,4-benzoquinol methylase
VSDYGRAAATYDAETAPFDYYRRLAVDLLQLAPEDTVLDVGCGTGLCFPYVQQRIGQRGRVIGVDRSSEMLQRASGRVADHGWRNVTLIEADPIVDDLDLPVRADALLLSAVHDVMQAPAAIERVLALANPGATVVATGGKWAAPWFAALNVLTFLAHWPYVSSFSGFSRPWRHLEAMVPGLEVRPLMFGSGYIAWGTLRAPHDRTSQ